MSKTLIMRFRTATGKEVNVNVTNPKDTLTGNEVTGVGTMIAQKNIFLTKSGELTQFLGATIDEKNIVVIV